LICEKRINARLKQIERDRVLTPDEIADRAEKKRIRSEKSKATRAKNKRDKEEAARIAQQGNTAHVAPTNVPPANEPLGADVSEENSGKSHL
jgi:hypothetical protein